jgi:hypothetical protein
MCILWRQPPQPAGLSLILQAILACCHLALQPARCQNLLEDAVDDEVLAGINRIATHFTKTATEYDRKNGMKWLSCTAK